MVHGVAQQMGQRFADLDEHRPVQLYVLPEDCERQLFA
jgi:hypothetical protein